jgi:hypothetical protein
VAEHVRILADEDMGGRLTGTEGERRAAAYLVNQLERMGAEPLAGLGFRQDFEFAAGTRDAGSSARLEIGDEHEIFLESDEIRALSFSSSASVTAAPVFAGYGIVAPEALGHPYDSYAGIDVDGKIAVVLRYFPEDLEHEERIALSRYAGLRYKALAARERGAVGLLVVSGPRSPNAGKTVPPTLDTAVSGSGIVAASAGGDLAEALFQDLEQGSLEEIQKSLDDGNPHVSGFELPGRLLTLDVSVARERRTGANVLGVLPGSKPTAPADAPSKRRRAMSL